MQSVQITPRQFQLLELIASYEASRCYSATIGELASELGISRSTAYEHIDGLRRKRLLSQAKGKARCLSLTRQGQELLDEASAKRPDNYRDEIGAVPLLGKVAAGVPIEAIENSDSLSMQHCFGTGDDVFALEVVGDSMIDEDIYDGDYVMCKKTSAAANGQMVIAICDDENATLKRFYRESGRIRLQPANDDYEPIYPASCRIEAVVLGLVRKF